MQTKRARVSGEKVDDIRDTVNEKIDAHKANERHKAKAV